VGATTRVHRFIGAERERVYAAFVDPEEIPRWRAPDGMTAEVHELEARPGGRIRLSLAYDDGSGPEDIYRGRFVELIAPERIVQVLELETTDPALRGVTRVEITLREESGGTLLEAVHDGLPEGVSPRQIELEWEMSLAKLAALVEE
jgi:uncharacterized protein YndB with AHSA1/START domain